MPTARIVSYLFLQNDTSTPLYKNPVKRENTKPMSNLHPSPPSPLRNPNPHTLSLPDHASLDSSIVVKTPPAMLLPSLTLPALFAQEGKTCQDPTLARFGQPNLHPLLMRSNLQIRSLACCAKLTIESLRMDEDCKWFLCFLSF